MCVLGGWTGPVNWRLIKIHVGRDHVEPCGLQGPQRIPISVFSWDEHSGLVNWILLSHLGVTCLPRRCRRSVACCAALASVNYTSQVRRGWQDYYNIWCDVAFYYHHLTFSSFPKLWERERCYMVHMTGLYLRVWRKDSHMHCTLKIAFCVVRVPYSEFGGTRPPTLYQKLEYMFGTFPPYLWSAIDIQYMLNNVFLDLVSSPLKELPKHWGIDPTVAVNHQSVVIGDAECGS